MLLLVIEDELVNEYAEHNDAQDPANKGPFLSSDASPPILYSLLDRVPQRTVPEHLLKQPRPFLWERWERGCSRTG